MQFSQVNWSKFQLHKLYICASLSFKIFPILVLLLWLFSLVLLLYILEKQNSREILVKIWGMFDYFSNTFVAPQVKERRKIKKHFLILKTFWKHTIYLNKCCSFIKKKFVKNVGATEKVLFIRQGLQKKKKSRTRWETSFKTNSSKPMVFEFCFFFFCHPSSYYLKTQIPAILATQVLLSNTPGLAEE